MKPKVSRNNPYPVDVVAGKTYEWCNCGISDEQPFCDGVKHKIIDCAPLDYTATESGTQYFCGCKQTRNPPFCDGTHSDL